MIMMIISTCSAQLVGDIALAEVDLESTPVSKIGVLPRPDSTRWCRVAGNEKKTYFLQPGGS
jgi:hypothetical protein